MARTFDRAETIRAAAANLGQIFYAPPSLFAPNPDQPRQTWNEADVIDMARSVANFNERGLGTGGSGFIYPLKVRLPNGAMNEAGEIRITPNFQFPIISGETKWRAATMLTTEGVLVLRSNSKNGDKVEENDSHERIVLPDLMVPFVVEDVSNENVGELAFAENNRRTDLNPLDEARYLYNHRVQTGESLSQMAARFQKGRRDIAKRLSLLKLGDDCKALLVARPDTIMTALRINEVQSPTLREELITEATKGTSYRQIDARVASHLQETQEAKETASSATAAAKAPDTQTAQQVSIQQQRESGSSTRGGGVSRGRVVTGITQVEARRNAENYLSQSKGHIASAREWMAHLSTDEKRRLVRRYKAQIEAELGHLEEILGE